MTLKELRELSGMTRTQFADYFDIPYRTIQDWELGNRTCNDYIIALLEYKLRNEGLLQDRVDK
jgi:DNA-binding transcriptional regulator YiaG